MNVEDAIYGMISDTEVDNLPEIFGENTHPETDNGNYNTVEYILDSYQDRYTPLQGSPLVWKLQGNPNIWSMESLK